MSDNSVPPLYPVDDGTYSVTVEKCPMSDKAEQKHTPLPWEVCNLIDIFSELGAANAAGKHADASDGWLIADCSVVSSTFAGEDGLTELSLDEKKANAAFIVKACNNHYKLVEALEEMIRLVSPGIGTKEMDSLSGRIKWYDRRSIVLDKARQALAEVKS